MQNVNKIAKALEPLGVSGVSVLHETHHPAILFTTECGKIYRADFATVLSDEEITRAAKAIEDATGLKVDWCGHTRGAAERDEEEQRRIEESRRLSADIERETKPVDTQARHKAQLRGQLLSGGMR